MQQTNHNNFCRKYNYQDAVIISQINSNKSELILQRSRRKPNSKRREKKRRDNGGGWWRSAGEIHIIILYDEIEGSKQDRKGQRKKRTETQINTMYLQSNVWLWLN